MIYILNKQQQIISTLSNKGDMRKVVPYFEDIHIEELDTGVETFEFKTLSNTEMANDIQVGNYVAFKDEDCYKIFQIKEVQELHTEQIEKSVYCEGACLELLNEVLRPMTINSANLKQFLNTVLSGTSWSTGMIDVSLNKVINLEISDYENVYKIMQETVIEKFGGELRFRVEIENNRIISKNIDVFAKRGRVTNHRFEYGVNLTSVEKIVDSSELVTALIGVGKDNLSFKDVEANDKPKNQDFIISEDAYNRWNNNGSHIMGVFNCESESSQELLKLTRDELQRRSEPKITYNLEVELLGDDVSLGDEVFVIDNEFIPPLHLSARVSVLDKSKTDRQSNRCTLSNFKEVKSNITSEMRALASGLAGKVDDEINKKFPVSSDDIKDGAITQGKIESQYLSTITSDIVQASVVETEKLVAKKANIEDLNATNANIENLKVDVASVNELVAEKADITDLNATNATIENLKVDVANVNELVAGKADITELNAVKANVGHLSSEVAEIGTLVNGNLTSDNIHSLVISSDKVTVQDAFIKDAMIDTINANKITSGSVDTSKVTITSETGGIVIANNTQQFKDKNNKVRVQIGEDKSGDFNFSVYDETGVGVLIDHTGVKEGALAEDIIKSDMIASDAVGEKQIDYNSFSQGFNKDTNTNTLKATKVRLDNQNQSLEVGFNQLKTQSDDTKTKTETNSTDLRVQQGQIQGLISDTIIEKDGESIKIKDAYSEMEQTVNSFGITLGEHSTRITEIGDKADSASDKADGALTTANGLSGKVTEVESKQSQFKQDLNGITQRVEGTESTTTTLTTKVNNAQTDATKGINDAKAANDKATTAQNSANTANSKLTDIASDNKLTASEKQSTKKEWDVIVGEKPKIVSEASKFGVSYSNYESKYNTLNTYITPLLSNLTTTSDINGATYRANFKNYYDARQDVLNLISSKAKQLADNAQGTANTNKTELTTTKNKVSTIETNLNSITSRVGTTETKTATLEKTTEKKIVTNFSITGTFDGWNKLSQTIMRSSTVVGNYVEIKTNNNITFTTEYAEIDPNKTYKFNIMTYNNSASGTGSLYIGVYAYDKDKNNIGVYINTNTALSTNPYWYSTQKIPQYTSWKNHDGYIYGCETKVDANTPKGENAHNFLKFDKKTKYLRIRVLNYRTSPDYGNGLEGSIFYAHPTLSEIDSRIVNTETRLKTAESQITESAITNTVKKNFYTKTETDGQITSKGYQTASQVQQTVDKLQMKFEESGGYNLLYNSNFRKDIDKWAITSGYTYSIGKGTWSSPDRCGVRILGKTGADGYISQSIKNNELINGAKYTLSGHVYISSGGTNDASGSNFQLYARVTYTDDTKEYFHTNINKTLYDKWQKVSVSFNRNTSKTVKEINVSISVHKTTKYFYVSQVMLEQGATYTGWSPNPNEVYDGITTIDKDGVSVNSSNSNTLTQMTANGFYIKKNNSNIFSVDGNGLKLDGEFNFKMDVDRVWLGETITRDNIYLKSTEGAYRVYNPNSKHPITGKPEPRSIYYTDRGVSTTRDGNKESSAIIDIHNVWYKGQSEAKGLTMYSDAGIVGLVSRRNFIQISPEWENAGNNTFSFQVVDNSDTNLTDGLIYYGSHAYGWGTRLRMGKNRNTGICIEKVESNGSISRGRLEVGDISFANDDRITYNDTSNEFSFIADGSTSNSKIRAGRLILFDNNIYFSDPSSATYDRIIYDETNNWFTFQADGATNKSIARAGTFSTIKSLSETKEESNPFIELKNIGNNSFSKYITESNERTLNTDSEKLIETNLGKENEIQNEAILELKDIVDNQQKMIDSMKLLIEQQQGIIDKMYKI
ncbi:MAG: phage tail spike protein [Peptostreptococcaceae bacterium]